MCKSKCYLHRVVISGCPLLQDFDKIMETSKNSIWVGLSWFRHNIGDGHVGWCLLAHSYRVEGLLTSVLDVTLQ